MSVLHPETFAELVRRHRLAWGLTQQELAERAGISPRGVRALEAGERQLPQQATVRLLADECRGTGGEGSACRAPESASPQSPCVARVAAHVAARQGDPAEARTLLEEALGLCRAITYPYMEAQILADLGQVALGEGRVGDARAQLERVIFRRLGARPYLERTEQALAALVQREEEPALS
jgi:transcriptional regulator with XRE-family HTH domain